MEQGVVQRWLRQVVGPYDDQDRVFADVDRTLSSMPSLSPKTEVYTYDDGRTQLLLELTGTIPIQYRGATYNIPMAYWIPRNYPREAPLAYVTPTSDMLVRKGKHVDLSGRVGGPYLEQWQRKWEACNLLSLVHDCQGMFGQEPPVYAKPKQTAAPSPAPQPAQQQSYSPHTAVASPARLQDRAPPPRPGQRQEPNDFTNKAGPPLRPPKPGQSYSEEYDGARHASSASPTPQQYRYHSLGPSPSPMSPHAFRHSSQDFSVGGGMGMQPRYSAEPAQLPPGSMSPGPAGMGGMASHRHASWNGLPAHLTGSHLPNDGGAYRSSSYSSTGDREGSVPPGAPPALAPRPPPLPPHAHGGYQQQQQQHRVGQRANSLEAPSPAVAAPPRPPNPELLHMHGLLHAKIQARLQHLHATSDESHAQLKLLGDDLDRGELAVKDEMARLEAVRDVCRATGDQLNAVVDAGVERVSELRSREEPDVDGLLSATSLVGNQLIDLVAEDNAIEDTLYHLGRALNSEVLDLDRFLKQTRFLAREQFMRRALAHKICHGMGWQTA